MSSRLLASAWREFHLKHERLKKAVHNGFRYPLPRWGRWMMGGLYFTMPIVGGYYVMQWAISKAHASIGVNGELLPTQHLLRLNPIDENDDNEGGSGKEESRSSEDLRLVGDRRADGRTVGAGGWGGGVRLTVSDEETQRRNREKLNKFLKQRLPRNEAESMSEQPKASS